MWERCSSRLPTRRHKLEVNFSPGITFDLPVNRPERLLLVQSIGKPAGEYLKIVAEGWNESRRKDREFMALPGQEYAR